MEYRRIILLSFILLAISGIVLGCRSKKAAEQSGPVILKVNDSELTPEDYMISLQLLYFPAERPRFTTPQGKRSFLQLLTVMELFNQEGKRRKLEQDPYLKRVVKNFQRYLIYYTLITQNINSETMQSYFERNFFHVAVIKISKPKAADDKTIAELRDKARKILDTLKGGADFAEMAKKYSDHPSKENGGDPGPITFSKQWPLEVLQGAATLKEVGELSRVVEAPDGFYILKLVEPYGKLDVSKLSDKILMNIFDVLFQENIKNYASQLQTMADIKQFPEVLDKVNMEVPKMGEGKMIPTIPPPGIPSFESGGSQ